MSVRLHAPEGAKVLPVPLNKVRVGDHVYGKEGGYWYTVRRRRLYPTYLALTVQFQRIGSWPLRYARPPKGHPWQMIYTSLTPPENLLDWRT